MGYALLFAESLASSLLLVATSMACTARWRRRWLRILAGLGTPFVLLSLHVTLTRYAAYYQFKVPITSWFYPVLALTLFFLSGTVWLMIRGLRSAEADGIALAAKWPRGKLAIALSTAAALFCMTFWNLDLVARQQLAALRTEAGALALSLAPPPLPDRDNAAPVYQQAFEAMGRRYKGDQSLPGAWQWDDAWAKSYDKWDIALQTGKTDSALHDPELHRFMERQSNAVRLLRQAASMPGCRFDRDYSNPEPFTQSFPGSSMILALRLLNIEMLYSAANGDYHRAAEDIDAEFQMAEHAASQPSLIAVLLSITMERVAISSLQDVLNSYPVPPSDVASVRISDRLYFRASLARAFRYEGACRLMFIEGAALGQLDLSVLSDSHDNPTSAVGVLWQLCQPARRWFASWVFPPVYRVFLLTHDVVASRHYFAEINDAVQLPYWQAKDHWRDLDQHVHTNLHGVMYPVVAVGPTMENASRAEPCRNAARLGLALYAYRVRNGKFPAKLDDLVPEFIASVPLSAYDGEPMRMQRTERGMTVYSKGPLRSPPGSGFPLDGDIGGITFTVPDVDSGQGKK